MQFFITFYKFYKFINLLFSFAISLIFIHANVKRAKMHTCVFTFFLNGNERTFLSFQSRVTSYTVITFNRFIIVYNYDNETENKPTLIYITIL